MCNLHELTFIRQKHTIFQGSLSYLALEQLMNKNQYSEPRIYYQNEVSRIPIRKNVSNNLVGVYIAMNIEHHYVRNR